MKDITLSEYCSNVRGCVCTALKNVSYFGILSDFCLDVQAYIQMQRKTPKEFSIGVFLFLIREMICVRATMLDWRLLNYTY